MQYKYLFLLITIISFNTVAQSLDNYKYVLVPNRYPWVSEADKYQINSLTTFLFNKYGFNAFQLGGTLPSDLNKNVCNTLTANVVEVSAYLKTKLKVVLNNCDGETLFVSQVGISSKKEYKWAYQEALREAFISVKALKYKYRESNGPNANLENTETQEIPVVNKENIELPNTTKLEIASLETNEYLSQDGSYLLKVENQRLVFYEDDKTIGSLILDKKYNNKYLIKTSEFSGNGYFQTDEVFIVEREIKGIQGSIKMVFVKNN